MSRTRIAELSLRHRLPGRARWSVLLEAPVEPSSLAEAAGALTGVREVRFSPEAKSLAIRFDPTLTDASRLGRGLLALDLPRAGTRRAAESPSLLGTSVGLANLVTTSLQPQALRTPLATAAALPVFAHGLRDLASEGITSHVLEALAVGISVARSDHAAANTTTFMLALGEYLEDSIAHRSDDLLKGLLRPASDEIWVDRDGSEQLLPAAEVRTGDIVLVGLGSVIPVDGTVVDGEAMVNESTMTGESAPVRRVRGDRVLSGTVLEEGRLRVYAEQVGSETAAARIAEYVEKSLAEKSSVQLRASRLADRLVPVVLGVSGASWLLTGSWQNAASVLQADFSCVLKLAVPVAFKSAMYGAGRRGILVKGATALEKLAGVDTVVFDKTGTLTTGRLEVTEVLAFDAAFSEQDLVCLAASVEEHSVHPMASAVVAACQIGGRRHFDHSDVEFVVAHGVASLVDGQRIVVGSRHFVEEDEGIPVPVERREAVDALYRKGRTLLYVGWAGRLVGVLALRDTLRPEAAATLARLRASGVRRLVMLTGDHRDRAAEIAAELGLDDFRAELLPEGKVEAMRELAADGSVLAFVGDGVNDAPALAGASVGIAMKNGADIARLTADVALLDDHLEGVAEAREFAVRTLELVASNHKLAVGVNSGILAGAALGMLSPAVSSVLHNGSTIAILLNALRGKDGSKRPPSRSGKPSD